MSKMITNFATKLLQIKMFSKFFIRLCFVIFAVQLLVIFIYNAWFNYLWESTKHMFSEGIGIAGHLFSSGEFKAGAKVLKNTFGGFYELQKFVFTKSLWSWLLLPMIMIYIYLFDEEDVSRDYIQGRRYITPEALNKLSHKIRIPFLLQKCIPFGEVYLPRPDEIKQTFVVGKPGSGKTNAFNQMIEKIRKREQKLIVHDFKGDYVEKFYTKNDLIFNPLDVRSIGWCLFNDCKSIMDIDGFVAALIPDSVGSEPFWNNAARDVMVGILRYCYSNNLKTNRDIWETAILPNSNLLDLLKATNGGERGAKHLQDPTGRTAMSVTSNLMQYIKVFEYMASMQGDFSITDWVINNKSSTIFITNYAKLQHTLSPMISLFVQTVGNILLSQSDNLKNRIYIFLDEFGQLPNMMTIQNLMTASRSKGGAVFIGVQDIGQIDKIYKKDVRTSILNSASNRIVFNCKDHDTAKFFSQDIGETEYYENTESQSLGMSNGDRINTSRQRRKEALVTPEDIQSLPDLTAFVSIGHYDITLSKFKYKKLKKRAEAFIQRPELDLSHAEDLIPTAKNMSIIPNENIVIEPDLVGGAV